MQPVKGKKRKKTKRRRLVDDNDVNEDGCAALYVAAQAHMKQEMKEAGLEGTLPMTFGSKAMITRTKKQKRSWEEKSELVFNEETAQKVTSGEKNDGVDCKVVENDDGEGGTAIEEEKEEVQRSEKESVVSEMTTVEKMRVVYDSDGGVAEKGVEKVTVGATTEMEEQSVNAVVYKKSSGKKKYKHPGMDAADGSQSFFFGLC